MCCLSTFTYTNYKLRNKISGKFQISVLGCVLCVRVWKVDIDTLLHPHQKDEPSIPWKAMPYSCDKVVRNQRAQTLYGIVLEVVGISTADHGSLRVTTMSIIIPVMSSHSPSYNIMIILSVSQSVRGCCWAVTRRYSCGGQMEWGEGSTCWRGQERHSHQNNNTSTRSFEKYFK